MQHKKELNFESEKDPILKFLAIFFVGGTVAFILLAIYYVTHLF